MTETPDTVGRAGRRWAWRATVAMLAAAVAASVCAAVVGWAARAATPPDSHALPVPSTDVPVPSSAFDPPLPDTSIEIAAGRFTSLDASTDGTAALFSVDGGLVLRLRNFRTDAGRGYVLYLVPQADARGPADGVLLGPLKGATGEQGYPVPVGARVDGPLTVLIWSRGFKGPVGHAVLRR
ncbi:MAG TPA: DM13 domain-containing protein [Pseudonocardiaceae bacterium]